MTDAELLTKIEDQLEVILEAGQRYRSGEFELQRPEMEVLLRERRRLVRDSELETRFSGRSLVIIEELESRWRNTRGAYPY